MRSLMPWHNPSPWVGSLCAIAALALVSREHALVGAALTTKKAADRRRRALTARISTALAKVTAREVAPHEAWGELLVVEDSIGGRAKMNALLAGACPRRPGRKPPTMESIHARLSLGAKAAPNAGAGDGESK